MRAPELKRCVPLAAWIVVIFTLLCVAGKIIGCGFLPPDDALRHAAKVVSGKSWPEILVLREGFVMDPHPGWHAILGLIHRWLGCGAETLVVLPVAGLMILFSLAALAGLWWPESWLGALLVAAICNPVFIGRLASGRPYVFTMAVYLVLLMMWAGLGERRPRLREILTTLFLIAAAAWIHGSFYQLILPAGGLLLAGRWRQALRFGALWAAGSVLGASFTGHPWLFLGQSVRLLSGAFGDYALTNQLVIEFRPTDGDLPVVLAVTAMLLWRARDPDWKARDLADPIFMMGLLGWLLGLKMARFWLDWGLPATLLWLALQFQKQFEHCVAFNSGKRLLVTLGLAAGVFLGTTSDRGGRWTWNFSEQHLTQDNPGLTGWLPESGGIIYSVDMTVFYDTFFKNPTAPWRYVLGFEPALMRPEDLAVMRRVQWNFGDLRAYEPWVKKMRRQDRLIIPASSLPANGPARTVASIPELEWLLAPNDWWIGRLPQKTGH
jgi:hypothetical protein